MAWGVANNIRGKGIIAAGMESGELGLWDPEKILSTSEYVAHQLISKIANRSTARHPR